MAFSKEISGINDNRIEFIDVAKGIGIILVVFGHVVWGGSYAMQWASELSNFIYSFHMPLFFVISGLCIKDSKSLSVVTFNKMVRAYLVPYVVWTVIYTAIREAKVIGGGRVCYRLE